MPTFISIAAHTTIDTFVLLLWHKVFVSHILHGAMDLPHLKTLIDYYIRQCQPAPLALFNRDVLCQRQIAVSDLSVSDDQIEL